MHVVRLSPLTTVTGDPVRLIESADAAGWTLPGHHLMAVC